MGKAVEFHLDFIVSQDSSGQFQSLHGAKEVSGDIVQLCAMKYYPEDYKYMKLIVCQNKDAANVDTNWEACAKENGIDAEKLRTCLNSDEGRSLLTASMQKAQLRQASGSPTMYVNDASYQGARDALSFQRAICQVAEHDACKSIPKCASDADCTEQPAKEGYCLNPGQANAACEYREPTKVNMVVLNDKRCTACVQDTAQYVVQLKTIFPGLEVKELDYSSTEGKKLYTDLKITYLPALLFDNTVKDSKGYEQISGYFEPVGQYLNLRVSADFDPAAEICDNSIDDNANGQIDCMEKKDKPEVELFVMSHCPYGTQIEKGILPVVETLGSKISFTVKFCDYAMHGQNELNEELQQYCIQKEQNAKYLAYLNCFLEKGDSAGCIDSTGIDKTKLSACIKATDEAYSVTKNFEDKTTWAGGNYPPFTVFQTEVDKYGVQGSPTLVINGVIASSARDPASLLDAICTGFKTPPTECSTELSSATPSAGFGFETTTTASSSGACG